MNPQEQINKANALAVEWRSIGNRLRDYKNHRFQVGSKVRVNNPRFVGVGIVAFDADCQPDNLAVCLENGNVWWYPIEDCTRI